MSKTSRPKEERLKPFRESIFSDNNLRDVAEYFLYQASGIDSELSSWCVDDACKEELWKAMIKGTKDERLKFGNRNRFRLEQKQMETIAFSKCDIYCHTKNSEKELDSLLRHLRNAIAHGNTFIKRVRNNTYIAFLDYDGEKRPSAKIATTATNLKRWRDSIEDYH